MDPKQGGLIESKWNEDGTGKKSKQRINSMRVVFIQEMIDWRSLEKAYIFRCQYRKPAR